ncbi:putative molybdenum carrier protein [Nocardioides sp. GCM10027113]|uniref:putative molybdenum carrier protein n=1 Tax=unclassified Nocardioides TaxID=2615069 RepID=UPI003612CEF1
MSGRFPPSRLVSGGQTGADRAALDWAVRHGVPHGGWCPAGGLAEDRPDPPGLLDDYPGLRATPTAEYAVRTSWNVRDSDATLLLVPPGHALTGGTAYTRDEAVRLGRPHLMTDGTDPEAVLDWLRDGLVLNVAGPRESRVPGTYDCTTDLLDALLRLSDEG